MKEKKEGVVVLPRTLSKIKVIIDEIYELTSSSPYRGSFAKTSGRYRNILSELIRRGCVIREGHIRKPIYTWNPQAMAPTKCFYETIATEIVARERSYSENFALRKRDKKNDAPKEVEKPIEEPIADETICRSTLSLFSDQELWDELKHRGARIIGNKLVIVKEFELA